MRGLLTRGGCLLLAAGLLSALDSHPAPAQESSRPPVARSADQAETATVRFPLLPGRRPSALSRARRSGGAPEGGPARALPLDPDARGLGRRVPRDALRPRPLRPRLFPFVLPLLGHPFPAYPAARGAPPAPDAGAAGPDSRRPAAAGERRPDGAAPPGDGERSRREVSCFEVAVRLAGGGTHRIRVDGAALGVGAAGELERLLRERMASDGALALHGLDGVRLHLASGRVRGVTAEPCPAVIAPGATGR